MDRHSCRTYFAVWFNFDRKKNAELLKERLDCTPDEIGITHKAEAEKELIKLGTTPRWDRGRFVIGLNEHYDVDVNNMLRITLKDLMGKESDLVRIKEKFNLSTTLEIVPEIANGSEEPSQYLSLERDIIEFLYLSKTAMDLDYYVI